MHLVQDLLLVHSPVLTLPLSLLVLSLLFLLLYMLPPPLP
uniref:Uncharacterized protein n=1 Tax=Picea glauca TaxID=3330 RepID=A0A101M512_PICGL|nr:hypothetical protein ABT39_MTgene1052 [Picea glauca]